MENPGPSPRSGIFLEPGGRMPGSAVQTDSIAKTFQAVPSSIFADGRNGLFAFSRRWSGGVQKRRLSRSAIGPMIGTRNFLSWSASSMQTIQQTSMSGNEQHVEEPADQRDEGKHDVHNKQRREQQRGLERMKLDESAVLLDGEKDQSGDEAERIAEHRGDADLQTGGRAAVHGDHLTAGKPARYSLPPCSTAYVFARRKR